MIGSVWPFIGGPETLYQYIRIWHVTILYLFPMEREDDTTFSNFCAALAAALKIVARRAWKHCPRGRQAAQGGPISSADDSRPLTAHGTSNPTLHILGWWQSYIDLFSGGRYSLYGAFGVFGVLGMIWLGVNYALTRRHDLHSLEA